MKILISGSAGMVGSHLCIWLKHQGHEVVRLVRPGSKAPADAQTVSWHIKTGEIEAGKLEGVDAVIHLAGANIAGSRWTPEYKRKIYESRVTGTRLLARTLAGLKHQPKVWIAASAIGFYGPRPDSEMVDENSDAGKGFLAEVCGAWEAATSEAALAGIRVVLARFGVVLDKSGGALAKMLPPFKFGLGGPIGSGRQMMSWIALDEIPAAMMHLIENEHIAGPVNLVAPAPASNADFAATLGAVLKRPAVMPMPAFAARLLFGRDMADEMLLGGAAVYPKRLEDTGYQFQYADLESALRAAVA